MSVQEKKPYSGPAFVMVPQMLAESDLNDSEFRLLVFLMGKQQGDGYPPFTQAWVADRIGWSPGKVKKWSQSLEEREALRIGGVRNETRAFDVLYNPCYGKDPKGVRIGPSVASAGGSQGRSRIRKNHVSRFSRQIRDASDDNFVTQSSPRLSIVSTQSDTEDETSFSSLLGEGLGEFSGSSLEIEEGETGEGLGPFSGNGLEFGVRAEGKQRAPTESQFTQIGNFGRILGLTQDQLREHAISVCDRPIERARDLTREEAADVVASLMAQKGLPRSDRMQGYSEGEAECWNGDTSAA